MLYRDYSRKAGEWVPNIYGGRENLESIAFLKRLNHEVRARISRRDHDRRGIDRLAGRHARRSKTGGLGFDFKWNMGWMHDTLHYMEEDPVYRAVSPSHDTFGMVYAYSERFVLPLSHDEVVHGKGRCSARCRATGGRSSRTCARILASCGRIPGKKLLFMGGEFGQFARVQSR